MKQIILFCVLYLLNVYSLQYVPMLSVQVKRGTPIHHTSMLHMASNHGYHITNSKLQLSQITKCFSSSNPILVEESNGITSIIQRNFQKYLLFGFHKMQRTVHICQQTLHQTLHQTLPIIYSTLISYWKKVVQIMSIFIMMQFSFLQPTFGANKKTPAVASSPTTTITTGKYKSKQPKPQSKTDPSSKSNQLQAKLKPNQQIIETGKTKSKSKSNPPTVQNSIEKQKQKISLEFDEKQLTTVGYVMVGLSALYMIVSDGNQDQKMKKQSSRTKMQTSSLKSNSKVITEPPVGVVVKESPMTKKRSNPQKPVEDERSVRDEPVSNRIRSKQVIVEEEEKEEDDLFSNDEEASPTIPTTSVPPPSVSVSNRRMKRGSSLISPLVEDDTATATPLASEEPLIPNALESTLPPFTTIIPAPEISKLPLPTDAVTDDTANTDDVSTTTPPPSNKPGGILDKLFQKSGNNRPSELKQAILAKDLLERDLRKLIASSLSSYVPTALFPELAIGGEWSSTHPKAYQSEPESIEAIKAEMVALGYPPQKKAELVAEVANGMLTRFVDRAVTIADEMEKSSEKKEKLSKLIDALDELCVFVGGAGFLFSQIVPKAVIDPVVYNGKAKKAKLESLYYSYMKESMNVDKLMSTLGMDGLVPTGGEAVQEGKTAAPVDRTDQLLKLQLVFGIKEAKKSSLEQKILKESLMSAISSGERASGLGGMMSALTGGLGGMGGLGGGMDGAAVSEMLKGMGGDGGGLPNIPGLDPNMSQEDMAAMSKEAMMNVKESLKAGQITKSDVLELEKMLGMDTTQMLNLVSSGKIDKNALGSEFKELLEIFQQLAIIKKK